MKNKNMKVKDKKVSVVVKSKYTIQIKQGKQWGEAIVTYRDDETGQEYEGTMEFGTAQDVVDEYERLLEHFPNENIRIVKTYDVQYPTRRKLTLDDLVTLHIQ